jgi:hypothetical protein
MPYTRLQDNHCLHFLIHTAEHYAPPRSSDIVWRDPERAHVAGQGYRLGVCVLLGHHGSKPLLLDPTLAGGLLSCSNWIPLISTAIEAVRRQAGVLLRTAIEVSHADDLPRAIRE